MWSSGRIAVLIMAAVVGFGLAACSDGDGEGGERTPGGQMAIVDGGGDRAEGATTTEAETTTSAALTFAGDDASGYVPLPPQPDGVPYPTDAWPEGDLAAALDGPGVTAVEAALDAAFDEAADPYGRVEAVVVVHQGELIVERYGRGYDGSERHPSFSVAKSVTHALLGILARDGEIDIFAPAMIEEWSEPGDPRAAITPDMLARMSSGLEWREVPDAGLLFMSASADEVAGIAARRDLADEPDTVFTYSTGATAINGRLIGDAVGTGGDVITWATAELFGPLGITSARLVLDREGYFVAGYGADMTARDFARFGLLYLRDGVWDGQRILPAGWVDYARTPSPTNPGYGSGFWLDGDRFWAAGLQGQRVVIVPEHDLVIVVLANEMRASDIDRLVIDLVEPFEG